MEFAWEGIMLLLCHYIFPRKFVSEHDKISVTKSTQLFNAMHRANADMKNLLGITMDKLSALLFMGRENNCVQK